MRLGPQREDLPSCVFRETCHCWSKLLARALLHGAWVRVWEFLSEERAGNSV